MRTGTDPTYMGDGEGGAATPPSTNGPDNLLSGSVWSNDGNGITLTYNFWSSLPTYYDGGDDETTGFKAFSAEQRAATEQALDLIESFTNITFVETTNQNDTQLGFAQTNLPSNVGAWAYYPSLNPKGGDVWTNRTYVDETGLGEGTYNFYTILHEIGHALGLQHTFTGGLTGDQNTEMYSVMAYNNSPYGNLYAGSFQLYDVWALQELYGANMGHNLGDDVYTLPTNTTMTIWDAGGNDTLDASTHTRGTVLNLESGTFSSTGVYDNNITIAYDVVIENATGGSGDDILYGNEADNILNGGAGNDRVVYTTDITDFMVQIVDSATAVITDLVNNWGTDTLISIEEFVFNNVTYDWTQFQNYATPLGMLALKFNSDSGSYQYYTNSLETDTLTATQMGYGGLSGNVVGINRGLDGLFITILNENGPSTLEISGSSEIDKITINGTDSNLDVFFYGDAGDDEITVSVTGNDRLYGQAGNDTIRAGAGGDIIVGGLGDDNLMGEAGNDYLYGGDGADILDGGDGIDRVVGNIGNDLISGGAGDDVLLGQDGDDTIFGGLGADLIGGGNGIDNINGDAGNDVIYGNAGDDVINGGDNDDTIYAGADNDVVDGDGGADTINGGGGNDTLNGGDGNDIIYGASGNDLINGDAGDDQLNGNSGDDIINGHLGNDTINGNDGNDTLNGNEGDDTIYGANGLDQINGGAGNDILRGNGGNDTVFGGLDNDNILGGSGHDTLHGDEGDDTIRGEDHNDRIYGGDGIDLLFGDNGDDLLQGDAGNDYLYGGAGTDYLSGGAGLDRFDFRAADLGSGVDRILDFDASENDRIDLRDLLSGYNSATDDINNFVSLTDSAGNSVLSVDVNGLSGGANFQDVVQINGYNGLDVNTLIANGNLLVE